MIIIDNKFNIGDIVYIITDKEQKERMIIRFTINPGNIIVYEVNNGTEGSDHYEIELTNEVNILTKIIE